MNKDTIETIAAAVRKAEEALGENLVWLTDQLDLRVRQGDEQTIAKLRQLNEGWNALAKVLPLLPADPPA